MNNQSALKMSHIYCLLNRPPGIGCQPDGFTDIVAEEYHTRVARLGFQHNKWYLEQWAWGRAEYPHPLPFSEIYRFEMEPLAGSAEHIAYKFWREFEDPTWAIEELTAYWQLGRVALQKEAERGDTLAFLIFRAQSPASHIKLRHITAYLQAK